MTDGKGPQQDLYALPLGEFTRARDELARRLRAEGRRDDAAEVKRLRKPTTAAWALNRLARVRPADVARLLEAGDRLRRAQSELLAGAGRAELDAAAAQERELVGSLARDAAAIASEAGLGSAATLVEKLRATLHAAAVDEQLARELAGGRLVRESKAVGLLGGVPAGPAPKAGPQRTPMSTRRPRAEARELERRLKTARGAEREARRRREITARAAERARERVAEAAERLAAARREEEEATMTLEAAEEETRRLELELDALRQRG